MPLNQKVAALKNVPTTATALYTNATANTQTFAGATLVQKNAGAFAQTTGATAKNYVPGLIDFGGQTVVGNNPSAWGVSAYRTLALSATRTVVIYEQTVEQSAWTFAYWLQIVDYDPVNDRYSSGPVTAATFSFVTSGSSYTSSWSAGRLSLAALSSSLFVIADSANVYSFSVIDRNIQPAGTVSLPAAGGAAVLALSSTKILTISSRNSSVLYWQAYNVSAAGGFTAVGSQQTVAWVANTSYVQAAFAYSGSVSKVFVSSIYYPGPGTVNYSSYSWNDSTNTVTAPSWSYGTLATPSWGSIGGAAVACYSTGPSDYFASLIVSGGTGTTPGYAVYQMTNDSTASLSASFPAVTITGGYSGSLYVDQVVHQSYAGAVTLCVGFNYPTWAGGNLNVGQSIYRNGASLTSAPISAGFLPSNTLLMGSILIPFNDRLAVVAANSGAYSGSGAAPVTGDIFLSGNVYSGPARVKYVPLGPPNGRQARWNATLNCWHMVYGGYVYHLDANFNMLGYEQLAATPNTFGTCLDVLPSGDLIAAGYVNITTLTNGLITGRLSMWTPTPTATGAAPNYKNTSTAPLTTYSAPLDVTVLNPNSFVVGGWSSTSTTGANGSWSPYLATYNLNFVQTPLGTIPGTGAVGLANLFSLQMTAFHLMRTSDTSFQLVGYGSLGATTLTFVKYSTSTGSYTNVNTNIATSAPVNPSIDKNGFWQAMFVPGYGVTVTGPGPYNLNYSDTSLNQTGTVGSIRISSIGTATVSVAAPVVSGGLPVTTRAYDLTSQTNGSIVSTSAQSVVGTSAGLIPLVELPSNSSIQFNVKTPWIDAVWTVNGNALTLVTLGLSNSAAGYTAPSYMPLYPISMTPGTTYELNTKLFVPPGESVLVQASVSGQVDVWANIMERV